MVNEGVTRDNDGLYLENIASADVHDRILLVISEDLRSFRSGSWSVLC
jgi:hypothetical protein